MVQDVLNPRTRLHRMVFGNAGRLAHRCVECEGTRSTEEPALQGPGFAGTGMVEDLAAESIQAIDLHARVVAGIDRPLGNLERPVIGHPELHDVSEFFLRE